MLESMGHQGKPDDDKRPTAKTLCPAGRLGPSRRTSKMCNFKLRHYLAGVSGCAFEAAPYAFNMRQKPVDELSREELRVLGGFDFLRLSEH